MTGSAAAIRRNRCRCNSHMQAGAAGVGSKTSDPSPAVIGRWQLCTRVREQSLSNDVHPFYPVERARSSVVSELARQSPPSASVDTILRTIFDGSYLAACRHGGRGSGSGGVRDRGPTRESSPGARVLGRRSQRLSGRIDENAGNQTALRLRSVSLHAIKPNDDVKIPG